VKKKGGREIEKGDITTKNTWVMEGWRALNSKKGKKEPSTKVLIDGGHKHGRIPGFLKKGKGKKVSLSY